MVPADGLQLQTPDSYWYTRCILVISEYEGNEQGIENEDIRYLIATDNEKLEGHGIGVE